MATEEEEFKDGFYGDKFARFEGLGENSVRLMLSSGEILPGEREAALVWLGERGARAISAQARATAAAEATAARATAAAEATAARAIAAAEAAAAAAVAQTEIAARQANSARNANWLAIIAIAISVISWLSKSSP